MKALGFILLLIGLVGAVVFGIQAMNNSETFSFLGLDVALSSANWTPVIISGVLAVLGVIILSVNKKKVA
ncbi:transglycosylase [Draconibacterium halophilum]|uniref:Transglycosylase n=1 Tax=Draconibacterium halophilum TaxID=2706887 RepID=A0A6C0RGU0_9BACT|nr:transglycosylase [Draconibacterium halophilum]QIA09319.1 transglycosylase [Draconibacterium halophilum]